jgi:hypothetical protein
MRFHLKLTAPASSNKRHTTKINIMNNMHKSLIYASLNNKNISKHDLIGQTHN